MDNYTKDVTAATWAGILVFCGFVAAMLGLAVGWNIILFTSLLAAYFIGGWFVLFKLIRRRLAHAHPEGEEYLKG